CRLRGSQWRTSSSASKKVTVGPTSLAPPQTPVSDPGNVDDKCCPPRSPRTGDAERVAPPLGSAMAGECWYWPHPRETPRAGDPDAGAYQPARQSFRTTPPPD